MKITLTGLIFSIVLITLSCRQPNEITDNKPFIKAISFAGIPSQNVNFDAAKSRITVHLPAILKDGLKPVLNLSKGATVVEGLIDGDLIDLTALCSCSHDPKKITLRLANQEALAVYEIIVIPNGPLKAQNTDEPFTFSRKGDWVELSLPVENLYTNPKVDMISFTNLATGHEEIISADAACLNRCFSTQHNRLIFSLTTPIEHYLKPGTYKIAFNDIKFPQHLVVTE